MKDTLRLYAHTPRHSSTATHFFIQFKNEHTWLLDDSKGQLLEWEEEMNDECELVGDIIDTETCAVVLGDDTCQDLHPELVWQIETLLSGKYLIIRHSKGVSIGRPISRSKYANDAKVNAAEEEHVRNNYGYSKLTVVARRNDDWEQDVAVACRKPTRR